MKIGFALALLGLQVFLVSCFSLHGSRVWENYKKTHNKVYNGRDDILHRSTWSKNRKIVEEHNKNFHLGLTTFKMEINKFSDMTAREFDKFNGFRADASKLKRESRFVSNRPHDIPDTLDWRDHGAVTEVKSQEFCGSCYAFSTTGAIEGQLFRYTGKLISLSEKQIMDCTGRGCNGGQTTESIMYVHEAGGIESEEDYPYEDESGDECKFDESKAVATVANYTGIAEDEEALRDAVANYGPISVCVTVVETFTAYKEGIYDDPMCRGKYTNHAVLLVGYGTEDGKDFWIVKNSWVSAICDQFLCDFN